LVFALLLLLFEKVRHKKTVYFCREEWMRHRKPPELPTGFLAWLRPLMATPKERILQLAGLDAYMLLRYIRMCLKICLCSGFLGMVVLVPMYLHGDQKKPADGNVHTVMKDPKLISMGNVKELHWLWVPIAFAYFTTFHTLYLLKREYKRFLTLRLTFLSVGDPDVDIQKSFSVMVDRIPLEYRSNAGLYALFDEIFPGDVHSAVVALKVDALEDLVQERAAVVDSLERALASRAVVHKEPMIFLPSTQGSKLWNRIRRKGEKVEAVAHHQRALDDLNARITNFQILVRQASDDMNNKEEEWQESERQMHQQQQQEQLQTGVASSQGGQGGGIGGGTGGVVAAGLLHGVSSRRMSMSPMLMGNAESRSKVMSQEPIGDLLAIEGATHLDHEGTTVVIDDDAGDTSRIGGTMPRHIIQHPHPPSSSSSSSSSLSTSAVASSSSSSSFNLARGAGRSNSSRTLPQQQYHQAPHAPPAAGLDDGVSGSTSASAGASANSSNRRRNIDSSSPTTLVRAGVPPRNGITSATTSPVVVLESNEKEEGEEGAGSEGTDAPAFAAAGADAEGGGERGREGGAIREEEEEEMGEEDIVQRGIRKQSMCDLLRRASMQALRAGANTGMGAVDAGQEVTKALTLLAVDTSSMSSTGFVTFKSMTSAAVASQSLLTMEPFMFTINPAPEPRDVVWQNLAAPLRLVEWREASTTIVITVLSLFWGALVSALYKLQSQLQLWSNTEPSLQKLGYWGRFALYLGIDYVPTLLLLIILAILPNFFWWLSGKYERMRTFSDIDASVMSRYFYYQMVNIYATIVGGALLDEVVAIAKDPRVIVRVLGCQVPVVAVYFMQIIVTKMFSALMWEFTRAWPLIRVTFFHYFTDHDRKTARQRRAPLYVPYMAYGWTYPSLLLVLTICLTYDVIMPIALILGAVYFFFVEILYTYHLLYVYVPQFEGGGRMWYKVFDRTLVALLLSHLTLIGYMAVLGAGNLTPVLLPLPCLLVPFHRHCQHGYQEASQKLSLLAARRIDDCLREEDVPPAPPPPPLPPPRAPAPPTSSPLNTGALAGATGPSSTPSSPPPHPLGTELTTSSSTRSNTGGGHPPTGLGRRRRSTMAINADGNQVEIMLPPEPPLVVGYFQISAYAQPSLTEGPQEAEVLPWHRQHSSSGNGDGAESGEENDLEQADSAAAEEGRQSNDRRPTSMNQSASSLSSALAKRMRISEALEDLRVPLSPSFPQQGGGDALQVSSSTSGSGTPGGGSFVSGGGGGGGGRPMSVQRQQQRREQQRRDQQQQQQRGSGDDRRS